MSRYFVLPGPRLARHDPSRPIPLLPSHETPGTRWLTVTWPEDADDVRDPKPWKWRISEVGQESGYGVLYDEDLREHLPPPGYQIAPDKRKQGVTIYVRHRDDYLPYIEEHVNVRFFGRVPNGKNTYVCNQKPVSHLQ